MQHLSYYKTTDVLACRQFNVVKVELVFDLCLNNICLYNILVVKSLCNSKILKDRLELLSTNPTQKAKTKSQVHLFLLKIYINIGELQKKFFIFSKCSWAQLFRNVPQRWVNGYKCILPKRNKSFCSCSWKWRNMFQVQKPHSLTHFNGFQRITEPLLWGWIRIELVFTGTYFLSSVHVFVECTDIRKEMEYWQICP